MKSTRPDELDSRLTADLAILASSSLGEALKGRAANCSVYTAVTGSALAMATSASAELGAGGQFIVKSLHNGYAPKLSLSERIAPHSGFATQAGMAIIDHQSNGAGAPSWAPNILGFAAFQFQAGSIADRCWVQHEYTREQHHRSGFCLR